MSILGTGVPVNLVSLTVRLRVDTHLAFSFHQTYFKDVQIFFNPLHKFTKIKSNLLNLFFKDSFIDYHVSCC